MSLQVRRANPDDLPAILRIWQAGLANSLGTAPASDLDGRLHFERRLAEQEDRFPVLVVQADTEIVAWQSLSPCRANPAVRGNMAEVSAYTSPAHVGRATLLGLDALFDFADASPLHHLVAFIATSNGAALRFAKHAGMHHALTLPATPRAPEAPPLALFVYACGSASRRRSGRHARRATESLALDQRA
jgi:L-amino acid N-acyltransferase YncA